MIVAVRVNVAWWLLIHVKIQMLHVQVKEGQLVWIQIVRTIIFLSNKTAINGGAEGSLNIEWSERELMTYYRLLIFKCIKIYLISISAGCPMAMCRMFCQFGFKKNVNNCDFCKCHDPCEVGQQYISLTDMPYIL